MIKVEDLRIGSILQIEDQIITVGKIDEDFISWKYNIKDRSFWNPYISLKDERLKPIELSEEILLKCEKITKTNGYPYKMLNGFIKMRNGVFFFKYYGLEIELPYLHTFQNLYWCLCNQELKINL